MSRMHPLRIDPTAGVFFSELNCKDKTSARDGVAYTRCHALELVSPELRGSSELTRFFSPLGKLAERAMCFACVNLFLFQ